jgi:hypothetical protein
MAIRIPIISEFSDKGIKQAQYEFNKLDSNVQKAGYVLNKAILPAAAAFGTLTQVIGPAVTAASNRLKHLHKALPATLAKASRPFSMPQAYLARLARQPGLQAPT